MSHLPLLALLAIFIASGAVIWFAGIQLSKTTDVLDDKLHLGNALGGLIVLAIATNLPEIAITVTAAASGAIEVAVSNILGGIALQTVVIVVLDVFGKRQKGAPPITYRAASLTLVIEAVIVAAVLAVVVAGTQLPKQLDVFRVTPQALLITVLWIVGLLLVRRASTHLPWHENGSAPDTAKHPSGHRTRHRASGKKDAPSTGRTVVVFVIAAVLTLVAGYAAEQSGTAAADQVGLSGVLFGATVLALATSLPEISTGLQAIRQGDENLAISDILGGNAFLPVLFLLAGLVSGKAVLPVAHASDIYLTAIAILLSLIYAVGLVLRPKRRVLGMGVDSLAVLAVYLVGVAGLFGVSG
jgi:cation:H+ antiporter